MTFPTHYTSLDDREHQSVGPSHPDDWRPGFTCEDCEAHRAMNIARYDGVVVPMFNIKRLQNENEAGITQQEMHRDVIESAKRDGREDQIQMKKHFVSPLVDR